MISKIMVLFFGLLCLGSCSKDPVTSQVRLVGRAVLPAATFVSGPSVGVALPQEINGCSLPFPDLPVQGFSSLIPLGEMQYFALQDNGFGTKENSPDYPLGWFLISVRPGETPADEGDVKVLETKKLSDPNGFFPYAMNELQGGREFTGSDLDPESFVRLPDGTFWVGDEFGPWLLHFSSEGELLSTPVGLSTPESMMIFTAGEKILRSPDHPDVLSGKVPAATLARSGGLEGMALAHDGRSLFVAVEKGVLSDEQPARRLILEFDLAKESFTDNTRYYMVDGPGISIAAMETWTPGELLLTERDGGQGKTAKIKRIYRLQLDEITEDGYVKKELICDLMDILDDGGLTTNDLESIGLGPQFTFPFVTPEVLVALDDHTLLVANDNNYPMSCGRRLEGIPDNTEFIFLELP